MKEETKIKIRDTMKARGIRPTKPMDWTGVKRPSSPLKGKIRSKEIVDKIAKSNTGRKNTEDTKNRISENLLGRFKGKDSPHWVEDRLSPKGRHERSYHDNDYKVWRKEVFLRDNYKCKIADENCKGGLEAHHILTWREYPELRYKVNNGICLCHAHHPKVWSEEKRLSDYFKSLVT